MINIMSTDTSIRNRCTGCMACKSVCQRHCILSEEDEEGFLFPIVDEKRCVECGACIKVCPLQNKAPMNNMSNGYIALGEDNRNSSSGGIFYELAKFVISQNGYVTGCIMDDYFKVKHILTDKIDEVKKMRGSKYVQSNIEGIYERISELIKSDKKVLFSGTPCQCAAIINYLGGHPNNLILIDLICHGVPAPLFWEKHIANICQKEKINPQSILFREKDEFKRTEFNLVISSEHDSVSIPAKCDAFYCQYIKCNSLRESCYLCDYSTKMRLGDITLGDCASWKDYMDFFPHYATSVVFINTKLGRNLWDKCTNRIKYKKIDVKKEIEKNNALSKCSERREERNEIYKDLARLSESEFSQKYSERITMYDFIKNLIKRVIPVNTRETIRKKIINR